MNDLVIGRYHGPSHTVPCREGHYDDNCWCTGGPLLKMMKQAEEEERQREEDARDARIYCRVEAPRQYGE